MSDMRIYFGYRTALQILRAARPDGLAPATGQAREIPDYAPGKDQVEAAIARVEALYSNVSIEQPVHILVGGASRCRVSATCIPHMCATKLSGKSFYKLDGGIYVSTPALAFVHMAGQEKTLVSLMELGYELCGSYGTRRTAATSAYQVAALSSVREIRDYVAWNPSLRGTRRVSHVLPFLADASASPRETKQALLLGLPKRYGGYGLGIPWMNYEVPTNDAARAISGRRSFRCDLCWPDKKLDVEYQSKENHVGEENRIRDSRRTNALIAMGWTVVCVTHDELNDFTATETIAQSLRRHLRACPRVRIGDYHARKLSLRRHLGLPLRVGHVAYLQQNYDAPCEGRENEDEGGASGARTGGSRPSRAGIQSR